MFLRNRRPTTTKRRSFMTLVHSLILTLLVLVGLTLAPTPAKAEPNWTRMTQADFPSRVKAIVYPKGLVLDARRSMKFGVWRVQFGPRIPIGRIYFRGLWRPAIVIGNQDKNDNPLICSTSVVKEGPCEMTLGKNVDSSSIECWLEIYDIPEFVPGWKGKPLHKTIKISCPSHLRVE